MRSLFTLLFSLLVLNVSAQYPGWYLNFDGTTTTYQPQIFKDTQTYHNNIWQIGKPHKAVFDSAKTYPNAIVTDTSNVYPINDTSVLIMKNIFYVPNGPGGIHWYASAQYSFAYKLNIDSGEIAKVELSSDSTNWIDCLDTTHGIKWITKPDFSRTTNGWKPFDMNLVDWFYYPLVNDTIYLYTRFTFISDGNQTNKDGWMMDNFSYQYWTESIEKIQNNNLINIYPNPSNGNIYLKQNSSNYIKPTINIANLQGIEVYKTDKLPASGYLHLSLPDGVYMLRYMVGDEYAVKRLIIKN